MLDLYTYLRFWAYSIFKNRFIPYSLSKKIPETSVFNTTVKLQDTTDKGKNGFFIFINYSEK